MRPENTLAAFRQALADGADGVELDVRVTADWVPVVLHDRDVGRTTDGQGLVDELPLAAVQGLDAGAGERVPTLAEVLELLAGRVRVNLEVKQTGVERELQAVLADHPAAECAVSSFDWSVLAALRALDPKIELWPVAYQVSEGLFAVARELRAAAVALRGDGVTPAVVQRVRAARMRVVAWTVNRVEDARWLREQGVAGLVTDTPAKIQRGLATEADESRRSPALLSSCPETCHDDPALRFGDEMIAALHDLGERGVGRQAERGFGAGALVDLVVGQRPRETARSVGARREVHAQRIEAGSAGRHSGR